MSTASTPLFVSEPPASFNVRPPMVVDCSVLSAVLFDEPTRDEAIARLMGRSLHAPNLLDHEIVSVALKKRQQAWPRDSLALALDDYADYAIELHPVDVRAQFELAQHYALSSYDAAYLWLAAELKAPLVTFDRKLATAASAHLRTLS